MAPLITLYILAGCVGVAAVLFVVMIVLTAVRPPRLPDIPSEPPPPVQRLIRALTPPPIAPATPANAGDVVAMRSTPAPRTIGPPPPAPPVAALRPPVPAAAPPAEPPRSIPAPPIALPPRPTLARAEASSEAVRPVRWPMYPARRSRPLVRWLLALFVTSVLAAGTAVAYPALLDPPCDDYEWFGADTACVVRQYARDARAALAELVGLP
jgi:hypothetical protein